MDEGTTTWALVVGIDQYDVGPAKLRPLSGAVADAAAAVEWLRLIGVPREQIFLHTSDIASAPVLATQVMAKDAREVEIWASINRLTKVTTGTRLFVFLFGHAIYEPENKRLFFTQDFGVNDRWVNLSLDRYIDLFLSTAFRRQFLFMDGCNNLPYPRTARTKIGAGYAGPSDVTPRAQNSMVACYSCSQTEEAAEIGGHGLFTRYLLEALDPDKPNLQGLVLDWDSGVLSVDVRKLIDDVLRTTVVDAAGKAVPAQQQHPDYSVFGAPANDRSIVYSLPIRPPNGPVGLLVTVDSPQPASASLRNLQVQVEQEPYWALWRDSAPVSVRLPTGLQTRVTCIPNAGWSSAPGDIRFQADADRTLKFNVSPAGNGGGAPPPAGGPPAGGPPAGGAPGSGPSGTGGGVEIRRIYTSREHSISPEVSGLYGTLARGLGAARLPAYGEEVARGVRFFPHETGPEFHLSVHGLARGTDIAHRWMTAIKKATPAEVSVHMEVVPLAPAQTKPNLRLVLPRGGARRLAGYLIEKKVLRIRSAITGKDTEVRTLSLAEVENARKVRVATGPVRLTISLPWGEWSDVVIVPDHGHAKVVMPASVGIPPLRVTLGSRWSQSQAHSKNAIFVVGARTRRLRLRQSMRSAESVSWTRRRSSSDWRFVPPEDTWQTENREVLAVLGARQPSWFPIISGYSFAVQQSKRGLRVEPLSSSSAPEWDLLVTSGRLDALSVEQLTRLGSAKWDDPLLGLAVAYALYSNAAWNATSEVVEHLRQRFDLAISDVDLLELVADRHESGSERASTALMRLARGANVPVFRWGISIALNLLSRMPESPVSSQWANELRWIEEHMSPLSIWTAWTDQIRPEVSQQKRANLVMRETSPARP